MIPFTQEQKERFVEHVSGCHSWYKHLSLINGGKFVLFLDEEAGLDYPSEHPKLPFGNSPQGYRQAFGLLTYCWKTDQDAYYHRDDSREIYPESALTSRFKNSVQIQLFPYVSGEFVEAIEFHQTDLEQVIREKTHEAYERLNTIFLLGRKQRQYWNEVLTAKEREAYVEEIVETIHANEYKTIETALYDELELVQLREQEKISQAIDKLRN